jgi:hypothetical protein
VRSVVEKCRAGIAWEKGRRRVGAVVGEKFTRFWFRIKELEANALGGAETTPNVNAGQLHCL